MRNNTTSPANTNETKPAARRDIVAIATPPGRGGVGIVRLSGAGIPRLGEELLGILPPPRYATLRDFRDRDGRLIDRGLAIYFPAPRSYTGEHVLELHAHGSPVALDILVRRCVELGAQLAAPGEFSERAFLNGRLDLAQAEAVADLIASGTVAAARSAAHSLQGEFSRRVNELVAAITELRVWVEADMDFGEEIVNAQTKRNAEQLDAQIAARLRDLRRRFGELRAAAKQGKLLRDGLRVVLTGPPNAGKSSLLNALTAQPRAIVSAIPGTTRDVLEQTIVLDGLAVEIMDTAGVRDSMDEIEAEGVRRGVDAQRRADLILAVVDDAAAGAAEIQELLTAASARAPVCLVRNKIDLSGRPAGATAESVAVSALTGAGLAYVHAHIKQRAGLRAPDDNSFIARARHVHCLAAADEHLAAAAARHNSGMPELVAEELSQAQRALGEITGEVHSDELLGMIFAQFCIGK